MTKKSFLLGALFTLSLGTLAADPPRAKEPTPDDVKALLKSASPVVPIKIGRCTAQPGGSCIVKLTMPAKCDKSVKPDPEILKITPQMTVLWQLVGGNWSFDRADGVKFQSGTAPFESRFLADNVWQAKVRAAPPPGIYSYTIKLRSKDGQTCEVDPAIWI